MQVATVRTSVAPSKKLADPRVWDDQSCLRPRLQQFPLIFLCWVKLFYLGYTR